MLYALPCTLCLTFYPLRVHVSRVGSEAVPAVVAAIAAITDKTATYTIPLSSVSLSSSTYFPVFHFMGELPAIRLYTTAVMYASDGCMHKQAADKHTLLNPAASGSSLTYANGKYFSGYTYVCVLKCVNIPLRPPLDCPFVNFTIVLKYQVCSVCANGDYTCL